MTRFVVKIFKFIQQLNQCGMSEELLDAINAQLRLPLMHLKQLHQTKLHFHSLCQKPKIFRRANL